jgi:hypothetical protein
LETVPEPMIVPAAWSRVVARGGCVGDKFVEAIGHLTPVRSAERLLIPVSYEL